MKNLENEIKAYSIKNALEHGRADPSKVLPKLFNHGLEKSEIKLIMPIVQKTIKEINSLSKKKLEDLYKSLSQYVLEHEEKPHTLPELANISDKMVFRLAPFPSGALHIGNAKTYMLNALYAEKYNAKIILVMDDTIGSEAKQLMPESYSMIEDAFKWLGVRYENVYYKSDRLEIYYKYALELIKKDKAYVCHCPQPTLKENREKGIECGCRQFPSKIQEERWISMFSAKEGSAVLRIKTSMLDPNPAFRDRVLFKISDRPHPRVGNKYRVWPTLEMSWAVDDHLLGITHILRGMDLQIETDMEKYIWDIFNWPHPQTIHGGMVNIEGTQAKISKSKAQAEVKSGQFSGWDDPRTWSMQSLKRRGILPEAIRTFIESIGLNKQNITIPVDSLYSINRKLIDKDVNRYSFVQNPIELEIKNKPEAKIVEIPIHPDKKETKAIKADRIFISSNDFDKFKDKEIRLLHLYNVKLSSKIVNNKADAKFTSLDNKDIQKLNWVSDFLPCTILMPNGEKIEGYAEQSIKNLKISELIQFERFGFCRFDNMNNNTYEFWFTHK